MKNLNKLSKKELIKIIEQTNKQDIKTYEVKIDNKTYEVTKKQKLFKWLYLLGFLFLFLFFIYYFYQTKDLVKALEQDPCKLCQDLGYSCIRLIP